VIVEWVFGDAGGEIAAMSEAGEVALTVVLAGPREADRVDAPASVDGAAERCKEVRPVRVCRGVWVGPGRVDCCGSGIVE